MRLVLVLAVVTGCGGSESDPDPSGMCEPESDASGEASFYDATGEGNCSFDASPEDLLVGAMNDRDYGTADWCGGCVEVDGPDGSVTVRIVDRCPGCAPGDIDLSREAFGQIAPLSAGRVPITWREVPCNVSGSLGYHFQDGANAFYTAIQIRNHRYPIAALAARNADGSWRDLPRVDYNYFVADPGLGDGPYALQVTDQRGHVIVDEGIALGDAVERTGAAQLEVCP